MVDPKKRTWLQDVSTVVPPASGLIAKVYARRTTDQIVVQDSDIEMRGKTVLPGLVDAYTHGFPHAYFETPLLNQMRDEPLVESSACLLPLPCWATMLVGYTTYRDPGTKGAGDADVHVQDAINRGTTPDSRIFCERLSRQMKTAFDMGVKIEAGGGTGALPHGENVRDVELLLQATLNFQNVPVAATVTGWEACYWN